MLLLHSLDSESSCAVSKNILLCVTSITNRTSYFPLPSLSTISYVVPVMPHAVMMCFVETRCFIVVLVFGFSSFSDLESSTDSKSL
jgi:hypothetical protein